MKSIIPPMGNVVKSDIQSHSEIPALEPAVRKIPVQPQPVAAQEPRPTLGRRTSRYDNIAAMLSTPAYQRRNVQFIVDLPSASKETLKDGNEATAPKPSENSLFD